ncbi:MAG TPA: hypothetical protein PK728_11975 [Bacillota bacterium]|nr:hypothetical protein [Bacillota bacterium]
MYGLRNNNGKTNEISGLALAVLCGERFADLLISCENCGRPLKKMRLRRPVPEARHVARVAGKSVCLRRYL